MGRVMALAAGTEIEGRYRVEALLGKGGMAAVYRVTRTGLGTSHALKVLTVATDPAHRRVLQEGRVQGTLRHPNVVAVIDVVEVMGSPGLVMELVAGPTLEALLALRRPTLAQADELARGILAGVAAAHAAGLVHRDLKPGNVLLAVTDRGLVPKIADFGLAKILAPDGAPTATRSGTTLGTPAYMAPEQIRDARSVDARADVFSLGALLYELVTGTRAFDGRDALAVFEQIASGRYVPPRERAPMLPERMERAIVGALVHDRDRRTASVEALREIWEGDDPVAATWSAGDLLAVGGLSAPGEPLPSAAVTFTDSVAPAADPPVEPARPRRWVGLLSGAAGLLLLVGGLWSLSPGDRPVFGLDGPPRVASPIRADLASAWDALLATDFATAERLATRAAQTDPDDPAPALLLTLAACDDEGIQRPLERLDVLRTRYRDGDGPLRDLIRASTTGDFLDLAAYARQHPDDAAAGLLAVVFEDREDHELSSAAELATRSDSALAHWYHGLRLLEEGRLDDADRAVEAGLARARGAPRLLQLRAEVRIAEGRLEEARDLLLEVLRADAGLVSGRRSLVTVLVSLGDEAGAAPHVAVLQSEATSVDARLTFARDHAAQRVGMGQIRQAFAVLEGGHLLAERERRPTDGLRLALVAFGFDRDLDRQDRLAADEDRIRRAAASPEIPGVMRELAVGVALLVEGIRRARSGDVAGAADVLDRLERAKAPDEALAMMRLELAGARGDLPAIEALTEGEECAAVARRGRMLHGAGADARAREVLRALDGPAGATCKSVGVDRYWLVDGLSRLSELAAAAGDPVEAKRLSDRVRALWPHADPDAEPLRRLPPEPG